MAAAVGSAGDAGWAKHYSALAAGDRVDASARSPLKNLSESLRRREGEREGLSDAADAKRRGSCDVRGRGSVFATFVNLTKTIMGAGILALPYALQEGGAGIGVFSLVITGAFSLGGFLAIGYVCSVTGASTYREAWARSVGTAPVLVNVAIGFECAICCVGYVILILDYVGVGFQGLMGIRASPTVRAGIAAAIAVLFIPMCLKTDFHSLRFTSLFGNVAMFYTLFYVIFECALWEDHWEFLEEASFLGRERDGIFRSTCVMTSAYIAHYSAPDLLSELSDHPAPWRGFCLAAVLSFVLVVVAYGVFAMAGFARFAPGIVGNVLLNYDSGAFVLFAWITMAATLIVTFPLQFKPARDTMVKALGLRRPAAPAAAAAVAPPPWPWALASAGAVAVMVAVGVVVTDISRVLAFRGALLGSPISFVMPGFMLLYCPSSTPGAAGAGAGAGACRSATTTVAAWLLIVFGTAAGVLGLYCAVQA